MGGFVYVFSAATPQRVIAKAFVIVPSFDRNFILCYASIKNLEMRQMKNLTNNNLRPKMDVRWFVRVALFIALATVLTMFPQIKTPTGGYVHFGDSIIYLASVFMGPLAGAVVGAVGHALADLISGYAIFAPLTFIVKGLMGYCIGKILYQHISAVRFVFGGLAALLIVVFGYFLGEIPLLGMEAALVVFISSPVQWLMSVLASAILIPVVMKIRVKIGL